MQPGSLLEDRRTGERRFRVERLLHEGKHYQIALGQDTHLDGKLVCLKAIEYSTELLKDSRYIAGRRQALEAELAFLTLPSPMLPEPLDFLRLEGSPAGGEELVLVYEYQHGESLYELVTQRFRQGMPPQQALSIWRDLVVFARDIHRHGYLFRDFDPRHVIVGFDDVAQVVGCGNAVKRGEKMNVYKMHTSPRYTAPEIRRELSGKVVTEACDTYSLGCLLSFMLTGTEPSPTPEAPLEEEAYDALRERLPAGYKLVIARCLQPLAQKRFKSAEALLPFCTPSALPSVSSEGFGLIELPAPWEGPEGMDNRALRSRISPGPLISQKQSASAPPEDALPASASAAELAPKKNRTKTIIALVAVFLTLVVLATLALLGVLYALSQSA